jgi:YD repeat-containing protein
MDYFYDDAGRLVAIVDGELIVRYGYDAGGRMVLRGVERLDGPVVMACTPMAGAAGTRVRLRGARFAPGATALRFGAVEARILACSEAQIVAEVPPRAATGRIVLSTSEGRAESPGEFVVLTDTLWEGT